MTRYTRITIKFLIINIIINNIKYFNTVDNVVIVAF